MTGKDRKNEASRSVEEHALRRGSSLHRALFEASPDGIVVVDAELRIEMANQRLADMLQVPTASELVGRSGLEFLPASDHARPFELVADIQRGTTETSSEWVLKRPDGTELALEVHAAPLVAEDGTIEGFFGLVRDVTARRELERQLLHRQKLESVGQLAAGIAHDFSNLLSPIRTLTSLLLEELPPNDPSRRDLTQILKAAERASQLTRQLLAFGRKQQLDPELVDLAEDVRRFVRLLRRTMREDISLVLKLPSQPCSVQADQAQLEQILLNLALNAQDAMPQGGTLTMALRETTLDAVAVERFADLRPAPYAELSFSDTGRGIGAAHLPRIFEPFFTTKETGKGSGLGLATVYGIVKQHGGDVRVQSEPGRGTTFTILLPGATAPLVKDVAADGKATRTGGHETVLVVEDDATVRQAACRVLRRLGYVVLEADSGAAAVDRARQHAHCIDLLLTDVIMPGMNGRQLYEQVAAIQPDTKVLYMSGYAEEVLASRGVFEKATACLLKPFSPESLQQRVREVLDS